MAAVRNHYWFFHWMPLEWNSIQVRARPGPVHLGFDALNKSIVRTKHLKLCMEVINAPENCCMKYFVHENNYKRSDAERGRLPVRNCYLLYAQDIITILNAVPCRYSEM